MTRVMQIDQTVRHAVTRDTVTAAIRPASRGAAARSIASITAPSTICPVASALSLARRSARA